MFTRRQAIRSAILAGLAAYAAARNPGEAQTPATAPAAPAGPSGPFTLPPLPYSYDALEPYIDAATMRLHHDKHHAAYVANLNKAVAPYPDLQKKSVEDLLKDLNAVPEAIRTAVRNNGGGHYNHSLFWPSLKKNTGVTPSGDLADALVKKFGSLEAVQAEFTKAALGVFGSGWAWLTLAPDGALAIEATPNQDTPLSQGRTPLIGLDVWEHAYYLKYNNRRPDYVAAWYNVVNWDFVADRYKQLRKA